MRKITSLIIAGCLFALLFSACGPAQTTEAPTEPTKSEAELRQMYEQAKEYEKIGKFKSEIEIYRQLYEYGYEDEGLPSLDKDAKMRRREDIYFCKKTLAKYVEKAISDLRQNLRDPNSLEIKNMNCHYEEGMLAFRISYIGDTIPDDTKILCKFSDSDAEVIKKLLEGFMAGSVEEEAVRFINSEIIYHKSQIAAFVDGTVEY